MRWMNAADWIGSRFAPRLTQLSPLLWLLLAVVCWWPAVGETAEVDLIMSNGAVYTVNPDQPWAEAVAIAGGRIVAVGSTAEVTAAYRGATLDLKGQMLLPAFHDAHAHPLHGGLQMLGCDLAGINDPQLLLAAIRSCAEATPGAGWLIGGGWELSAFAEGNPSRTLLDAIAADRPVLMRGADGHSSWVNSKGLAVAGITADTPDPEYGIIERDGDGEPSGTLRESAMALVEAVVPPLTPAQRLTALRAALDYAHSVGVTAIVDAAVGTEELAAWQTLEADGELSARVVANITQQSGIIGDAAPELLDPASRKPTSLLRTDAAKLFLDGVLEGETAALLTPYLDSDGAVGTLNLPWDKLRQTVIDLDARGIQVHMHAIGDAAVRQGLDAFEAARDANGVTDNRHHICHLQLVHPDDYPRFKALGVLANFQALWAYPDEYITEVNLPAVGAARVDRMYPIGSIERAGGMIVGGSDWSVSSMNPLEAIEVALTRRDPAGVIDGVLNAAEAVSLDTMIAAYTRNAAYLMHQETLTGSIEVGKAADLVVLEQNLFAVEPAAIGDVRVRRTLFAGRTVYAAEEEVEEKVEEKAEEEPEEQAGEAVVSAAVGDPPGPEVAAAMATLDAFMASFNARDPVAHAATYQFPHFRLARGEMNVWQDRRAAEAAHEQVFPALVKSGWARSEWLERTIVTAAADKVHIATRFRRLREDGTEIGQYDSLYVVTREGGRWGVKLRSSFL